MLFKNKYLRNIFRLLTVLLLLSSGFASAQKLSRASNIDIVEVYDVATDQWGDLKAPMPTPRSAGAWGVHKGLIYVAGGEQRTGQLHQNPI